MSKYSNLLVTIMCVNIMLILGGVIPLNESVTRGNVLSAFFTFPDNNLQNGASINSNFTDTITGLPSQGGGATTGLGFIDGIKMFAAFFQFLLVAVSVPFQLLFNMNIPLPMVFRILVGLPLTISFIFALAGWFRGNE